MNVFTTDHPLSSSSHGDKYRTLSWVPTVAVVLFPFILPLFWLLNATESGEATGYPPDPFWQVLAASALDSLIVAAVTVALGRFCMCIFRELRCGRRDMKSEKAKRQHTRAFSSDFGLWTLD